MHTRKKIQEIEEIKLLVDSFYESVRKDDILGPIFNEFINDWSTHLPKMYRFWQTVLLNEFSYKGNPFQPHIKLPVSEVHFERWVQLFHRTVDKLFFGTKAEEAKEKSANMAWMFQHKLDFIRTQSNGEK